MPSLDPPLCPLALQRVRIGSCLGTCLVCVAQSSANPASTFSCSAKSTSVDRSGGQGCPSTKRGGGVWAGIGYLKAFPFGGLALLMPKFQMLNREGTYRIARTARSMSAVVFRFFQEFSGWQVCGGPRGRHTTTEASTHLLTNAMVVVAAHTPYQGMP